MVDTFLNDMDEADDALADALGETATIRDVAGNNAFTVPGIFERKFVEVIGHEGYQPTFFCQKKLVLAVVRNYQLAIGGDEYLVVTPQDQGDGMVDIILKAN